MKATAVAGFIATKPGKSRLKVSIWKVQPVKTRTPIMMRVEAIARQNTLDRGSGVAGYNCPSNGSFSDGGGMHLPVQAEEI
jgi:hypothetical protein